MTTSPQHNGNTPPAVMTGFLLYCLTTPLHAHSDLLQHTHLSPHTVLYQFGSGVWIGLALAGLAALYYLQKRYLQRKRPHRRYQRPVARSPRHPDRD